MLIKAICELLAEMSSWMKLDTEKACEIFTALGRQGSQELMVTAGQLQTEQAHQQGLLSCMTWARLSPGEATRASQESSDRQGSPSWGQTRKSYQKVKI